MDGPDPEALRKVDAVALRLARIIGRRMAYVDFEKAIQAANDNSPQDTGARKDGADEE